MILILDFGAQYTQLIARRVREAHVYCEIHPFDLPLDAHPARCSRRASSSRAVRRACTTRMRRCPIPTPDCSSSACRVLGDLLRHGRAERWRSAARWRARRAREFGPADVLVDDAVDLFAGFASGGRTTRVWMSHGDRLERAAAPAARSLAPQRQLAGARPAPTASGRRYGVQFHPEVAHTPRGREILAQLPLPRLPAPRRLDDGELRRARGRRASASASGRPRVVCALSGGVDSTVDAALVHRAIGDRLTCIFVDNGAAARRTRPSG